jgi:hypothetical protein
MNSRFPILGIVGIVGSYIFLQIPTNSYKFLQIPTRYSQHTGVVVICRNCRILQIPTASKYLIYFPNKNVAVVAICTGKPVIVPLSTYIQTYKVSVLIFLTKYNFPTFPTNSYTCWVGVRQIPKVGICRNL